MQGTNVLFGQIAVVFGIVIAGVWGATQWTASTLGYQLRLGSPWFDFLGTPIYHPWKLFEWWFVFDAYAPRVFDTGGAIATIHAGSALGALLRLEQLILEVAVNPPRALIAEAVNVVIHIAGRGRKRRIESIARVVGFDGVGYQLADALETSFPELPPLPDAAPAAATSPSPDSLGELP